MGPIGVAKRWRLACGLLLVLGTLAMAASVDEPEQPAVNTLEGVVVSKADGKPVAGANVAMAHAEKGGIFIGEDGEMFVYGSEEKVLFFLTKRNGKNACEATADEQGRFKFTNFASLTAKYSVVAASAKNGLVILENVCPKDYADQPLRIEIDEPAYLEIPKLAESKDSELMSYVDVSLEPEAVAPEKDAEGGERKDTVPAAPRSNIYMMGMFIDASEAEGARRVGPLAGGHEYRIGHRAWSKRFGSSATLFETVVAAEAGKTLPVKITRDGGVTLTGQVTTREGSPLRDVNVMVKTGEHAELVLGALTDEKGNYTIGNAPAGAHKLELSRYAVRVGPG